MFSVPLHNLRIHQLINSNNQNKKRIQEETKKEQEERNRLFMKLLKEQKGINNE